MSPATSIAGAVWRRLPFFVWLIALWMLLWGQFTVLAALTVAVLLVAIFVFTAFAGGRKAARPEDLVGRCVSAGDVVSVR